MGRAWFGHRFPTTAAVQEFLIDGEQVQTTKRGIVLQSFPQLWNQVTIFLKKYITCEATKNPLASLTHHGLIKLIILRTLAQHNITWEQFTTQVQEPAPLLGVPIEEEPNQEEPVNPQLGGNEEKHEVWSPSNVVWGEMRLDQRIYMKNLWKK